jgi:hypothetical protein
MTKADALRALLEKVEAGNWDHEAAATWLWREPGEKYGWAQGAFNGSLDAAKALHEAVLPRWSWRRCDDGEFMLHDEESNEWACADHDNPARAWLIAVLRALIEEEG